MFGHLKGHLKDFSRICMKSLKDHARIIMGSKCNYVSITKTCQQDLERITVG